MSARDPATAPRPGKRTMTWQGFSFILLLPLLFLSACATLQDRQSEGFIDMGNGIVLMTETGLMWQKEKSPLFESRQEARQYVSSLELGGYDDWRLPTTEELFELYFQFDFGTGSTTGFRYLITGNYWVAGAEAETFVGAWEDRNLCEIDRRFEFKQQGHVRAVRP